MTSGDEFDASYQALRSVVTHPEFQRILEEIQSLPPIERLQAAFTQLTLQALAARGIPIPAGLTITTDASQDSAGPTTDRSEIQICTPPDPFTGHKFCIDIPIIFPLP